MEDNVQFCAGDVLLLSEVVSSEEYAALIPQYSVVHSTAHQLGHVMFETL
jgi:hypothetical protein